jgi:hypothetical protein
MQARMSRAPTFAPRQINEPKSSQRTQVISTNPSHLNEPKSSQRTQVIKQYHDGFAATRWRQFALQPPLLPTVTQMQQGAHNPHAMPSLRDRARIAP